MSKIKKLLTLEDLSKFCKEQKMFNFSSKNTGYQLSVQVPATFEVEDDAYTDNTLLYGNVKLYHIGPNRNGSSVTEEAAQKSLSTIAYKPLLANFCEIDGEKDFTSHDMIYNDDGTVTYVEHQIGCFTADAPYIKYDESNDKQYVYARVAIPKEYTDACSIIERKGGTKVSAELLINEMQYSAKDDILELTDIIVQGATCLGRDPETGAFVEEGMQGARLDIADFSAEKNSVVANADTDINDKLFEILEKLNQTISNFNINESGVKEGNEMDKFNELLELYGLTADQIEFEHEGLTDEELEAAFTEAFGDAEGFKKKKKCSEEEEDPDDEDFAGCGTKKKKKCEEDPEEDEEDFAGCGKKKRRCSVNAETGTVEFELSFDDIRSALYALLDKNGKEDSYSWICECYDNYFVYQEETYGENGYTSKYYKQSYTKNGDNVELSGDPTEVFSTFVTESEKTALDMMRTQYEELKAFKEQTLVAQEQAQKDAILNDEKYADIANTEAFAELRQNAGKFSVTEVEQKAKVIFADEVMAKGNYSAGEKKNTKVMFNFAHKDETKSAYGGLFED